ncbi:MAG: hypothetical protein LQ345_000549 [Seirophora villosa]|nr:MAG: hypothetical protein LQ345_000549 [Seirophora villosa]
MPARLLSMELSDSVTPQASSSPNDPTSRRKSGRVKQKPVLLQTDPYASTLPNGSGKRKRTPNMEENGLDDIESEETDPDENDEDPDEEELKERRRKSRSKKTSAKRAAKKARITAPKSTSLPVRSAVNGVKKPPKSRRPRTVPNAVADDDGTGLFSEIFSQGHTVVAVASEWITRYDQHNANAMTEVINFVLKCTGCDSHVDVHDIEDPDNAASKLDDLQDEYESTEITDYPLVSRAKGHLSFRATMTGFFTSLIQAAHAAGLLYSDLALVENIEVWVTTMSSSSIRPFRHTATVISLAIQSALCSVYSDLADSTANTLRQKEGEQKKKNVNKLRVAALQTKVTEGERKIGLVNTMLDNIFNAVYVHRYRDVDPKIRVDCVTALGDWISTAPDKFFMAQYLRYLGWVLSDTSAPTRTEVVKQLSKLYKRNEDIGRLHGFTERFRPRFVEMAMRDAEPGIRAAAVGMLDLVRETGLLEPDDIDSIGRLIFDSEPRVRKAVATFFAKNINDLFDSVVEELGGEEGMAEAVGEDDPDDPDVPRRSWLRFKCLAEVLQIYSSGDEEVAERDIERASFVAGGPEVNSRFALAAQAVYHGLPDVRDWEFLAGYLLYDNSAVAVNGQASKTPEHLFRERCQLNEVELTLLLEILNESVKQRLLEATPSETDKKGKKGKVRVEESREVQENTALRLAEVIPRLLRKFGANPTTAVAVLRLEHVLNLEIFEELRQGSTMYASLLDDINKQFLTHVDQGVLAEASSAILHARTFDDLQEVTDSKLQELWSDTINSLRTLAGAKESDEEFDLTSLCNTVTRIANLASVVDCVNVFESEARSKSRNAVEAMTASPAHLLTGLISSDPVESDGEQSEERGQLTIDCIKALLFYNMWLVHSLQSTLTSNTPPRSHLPDITPFASALLTVMNTRSGLDPVRLAAASACLDLYTLYASFRNLGAKPSASKNHPPTTANNPSTPPNKGKADVRRAPNLDSLVQPIPSDCQTCILAIFAAAERHHARLSHRRSGLEPAPDDAVDDAPEDPESEAENENDDDDDRTGERAQTRKLLAEKQLCELAGKMVLAAVGRVFRPGAEGEAKVRARLRRNERRLGANYREVVAFLEEKKKKRQGKAKPKEAKAGVAPGKRGKVKAGKMKSKETIVDGGGSDESEDEHAEEEEEEEGAELADDRIEDFDDEHGRVQEVEDEIMGD